MEMRYRDVVDGRAFVARIHYSTLGWWRAGFKRMISGACRDVTHPIYPVILRLIQLRRRKSINIDKVPDHLQIIGGRIPPAVWTHVELAIVNAVAEQYAPIQYSCAGELEAGV